MDMDWHGWSQEKVKQHCALLSNIVTPNIELAKNHQTGRVTDEVTNVTFTEGGFRDILKLSPDNQKSVITEYIESKSQINAITAIISSKR